MTDETQSEIPAVTEYSMFNSTGGDTKPYTINMQMCGVELRMEVETGATLSVIS